MPMSFVHARFFLLLMAVSAAFVNGDELANPLAEVPGIWAGDQTIARYENAYFSLRGHFVQGGLLLGRLRQSDAVRFGDHDLPLTDEKYFVLGLDRDAPSTLTLTARSGDQGSPVFEFPIARRDYVIQRIEGVAQQHVTPDPAQVARSRRESAKVGAARRQRVQASDFLGGFEWPAQGPLTGVFGSQRVYNGEPRRPHYGVDVAGPVGAPVTAPAAGIVTLAEPDLFFSGGTLILDHGHGLSSTFLHLSRLLVKPGERIERGQRIAEIGATGRATGPHLDWRMNWTRGAHSVRIDPQLLVHGSPELQSKKE